MNVLTTGSDSYQEEEGLCRDRHQYSFLAFLGKIVCIALRSGNWSVVLHLVRAQKIAWKF